MTETYATFTFPPGRYGRRRQPRRRPRWLRTVLVAAMTLGVVLVGGVAAYVLGQSYGDHRPYEATVDRYYDITDTQVVVQFTVVVPEGEVATCAVRARDADGAEVGREEVRVESRAAQSRQLVVYTLTTIARPVTGEVQRCWREG